MLMLQIGVIMYYNDKKWFSHFDEVLLSQDENCGLLIRGSAEYSWVMMQTKKLRNGVMPENRARAFLERYPDILSECIISYITVVWYDRVREERGYDIHTLINADYRKEGRKKFCKLLELGCPTVKYFAEIVAANWSYKDLLLELKRCEIGYYDFIKAYTKSSLSVNTLKLLDSVYNERELKELKVNISFQYLKYSNCIEIERDTRLLDLYKQQLQVPEKDFFRYIRGLLSVKEYAIIKRILGINCSHSFTLLEAGHSIGTTRDVTYGRYHSSCRKLLEDFTWKSIIGGNVIGYGSLSCRGI